MQHLRRSYISHNYISTLSEAFYMTLFQGGRHSRGDNNLSPRGGQDATPRLKLRLRHSSQAAPLGWRGEEDERRGAMQGNQVDRQGDPPVCLPAGPGFPVLGERAAAESEPTLWVGDANPLLHPVPTVPATPVEAVGLPRPDVGEGAHRPLHHCSGKGAANDGRLGLPLPHR